MTRSTGVVLLSLAGLAVGLAATARAADDTEAMLSRALGKRKPTFGDRDLARRCLSEWVDEAPDDPALRRALERIAEGCPPASEQIPALTRLQGRYSRAHAEAVARAEQEAGGGAGSPGGVRAAARSLGLGRLGRKRDLAVIGAIGVLVVAAGVGWMVVARRRRS